jgi:chemotaxis protein MotB
MRRVADSSRAGHDRWLVSYADLVTLLFACFATLYAASALDATGAGAPNPPVDLAHDGDAREGEEGGADARPSDALMDRLATTLEDDVRLRRADVVRDARGVVVSLPEQATFQVGRADVTSGARQLISRVVNQLDAEQYTLRIEGHTDDVPIRTAQYPSNWELSTARAGAVVAYLIRDLHYPPDRLSAAGYAEFHPLVPNTSAANRARNRRIDIVVIDAARPDLVASESPWSN